MSISVPIECPYMQLSTSASYSKQFVIIFYFLVVFGMCMFVCLSIYCRWAAQVANKEIYI